MLDISTPSVFSSQRAKGLEAPIGSIIGGIRKFIHRVRRYRKILDGGMCQVASIAAAEIYALDHHID